MPRACCVVGCDDIVSKRYRFPLHIDKACFHEWVKRVKHPRFKDITASQIYKSYYVCGRHFAPEFFVPSVKRDLRCDTVPTLFMPPSSENEEVFVCKPDSKEIPKDCDNNCNESIELLNLIGNRTELLEHTKGRDGVESSENLTVLQFQSNYPKTTKYSTSHFKNLNCSVSPKNVLLLTYTSTGH